MIVVDASVLVVALADDGQHGGQARALLRGERLAAPELIDLEVVSVLRSRVRAGALSTSRATAALMDLMDIPIARVRHRGLLLRIWELRDNMTAYDAAYVALAEALAAPLITADRRLARAAGARCEFQVV